jgi:hypothetical protein
MFKLQLTRNLILLGTVLLLGSSRARAADPGWPRQIDAPQATIVLYQPQPETFQGNILTARAAVAVTPKGTANPVYGTVWTSSRVETDRDQRTVTIVDLTVTRATFPNATAQEQQMLSGILQTEVPKWNLTISLDRLEASLLNAQVVQASAEGLRVTPPRVLFADVPSILVSIDGAPQLRPIEHTRLQRVVNTPFPLIYDPAAETYYLNGGKLWYSAPAAEGPWTPIDNPPAAVAAVVPADQGTAAASIPASGPPPRIVVATEPTELIVTDGAPQYAPITGTDLLSMTNTESDVILDVSSQQYYLLLSGRWFRSKSLGGPWSDVPPGELPASFQMIPPKSDRGGVRVDVAGTDEARLAVIDAQIPQTATIPRGKAKLKLTYDGPPRFEPIPGTRIEYAVNTSSSVLKIGRKYYACEQGAWYLSGSPTGPWTVATAVPPEVQSIPPSCPLYDTRYVYVYGYTPSVVYVGYTPAYFGCYPFDGVVIWGTGFYYRPWLGAYFFPRPATWGFHASYHSWSGWTFGLSYNTGPFLLGAAWGEWWGPDRWWGPGGYRGRTDVIVQNTRINIDNRRFSAAERGYNLYERRESIARDLQARRLRSVVAPQVAPGRANDVFAHRNGDIYRRTDNGWEARGRNGWAPSGPEGFGRPSVAGNRGLHPLEPDYRAREMGRSLEGGFRNQGLAARPGGGLGGRPGGGFGGGGGGRGGRR